MFDCQKFRNRMGWTQTQLADKLGLTQSSISMWNTTKANPKYNELCKLLELGMTIEEMFGEELSSKIKKQLNPIEGNESIFSSPEFKQGVQQAILDSLSLAKHR